MHDIYWGFFPLDAGISESLVVCYFKVLFGRKTRVKKCHGQLFHK